MISAILALFGSPVLGGLLGGVLAWFNRKMDLEAKRIELAHEKDRWAHELAVHQVEIEQIKAEAAGRKEVAIVEGESSIETARMNALKASFEADKLSGEDLAQAGWWKFLLVWADAFRRFIRPVATVVLLGFAIYVNVVVLDHFMTAGWKDLSPTQRMELAMQAFAWLTGQAAMVLSYWFVSRGPSKS